MAENFERENETGLTPERLAAMQTLEVKIDADFSEVLEQLRSETGADLQPRPEGYHLTIITPNESGILRRLDDEALAELRRIHEEIKNGEGITAKGIGFIDGSSDQYHVRDVDKVKKTAFIAFDIPALQNFRANVGLPPKDFHITLGFVGGDIHAEIIEQRPVKPGSPQMKNITGPISKQADPRFSSISLPKIHYGGLTGQQREQK